MKKFIFGLAAAVTLAAFNIGGAFAGKPDNSIRFAYDQAPESVDPYFNNVRIGVIIGQHVWDTLIYRNPETGEYKGELASAWQQVDDRTIEFDLQHGIKFHNGEEFDADDVVYTLNYVADPKHGVTTQQNVAWIEKAEKIDKYKVRLTTKEVFPAAIEYLSGPVVIHPNEYYEKVGPEGMNAKPVGTGPFRVTEYDVGKSITLEKNPDYFADSPKKQGPIEKIVIRFIPDRQTQMAEVLSDGVDFIMYVPKDQAEQLEAVPNLQVVSGETMRIAFMQMNSQENTPSKALKDERVRKAIIYAIDRETMVKEIVGAGSRVLNTICFPKQFGCTDEGAPGYEYNPDKAKALLAEAGYANGLELDLVAYRERNQTEAIIGYLKAVGINANLQFLQYAAMRDLIRSNKAMLTHQTWGSFSVNDVSAATPVYFGYEKDDISRDSEVRDLLKKGDTTMLPEDRKAAYHDALKLIAEHAYAVPLYSLPVYYVATADLNFKAYPDEMPRFWEMTWK
ncbi:ABC transporter substrate-binding protein [Phyllobacterium brassicacearum]|uniref:ABC transporter substrate-binding protein n=1 Tax=Phyllobacterium brassicacearum TaxID=314235 RepID=A0A2P7BWB6_9HYPH|nr:ABC transporter substrate-binding protein [Phyllobacterium brassicacearum]PSH70754.1 ABC transporter substrate-binding protein [Phyllobacterium brassicacearum]TDQ35768.1 peptide/nickel transport system substrate-binding protein [Phyllobacterium brassicacearum]